MQTANCLCDKTEKGYLVWVLSGEDAEIFTRAFVLKIIIGN